MKHIIRFFWCMVLCSALITGAYLAGATVTFWTWCIALVFSAAATGMVATHELPEDKS